MEVQKELDRYLEDQMVNEGGIPPPIYAADKKKANVTPVAEERVDDTSGLSMSAQVEAIVFASEHPSKAVEIVEILSGAVHLKEVEKVLKDLARFYEERQGGFNLDYIKGQGYQFRTRQEAAPLMTHMFARKPRPISRAALETLAIIAYRQPVTRAEIEFIRGVDAGSIMKNLLERGLIACVGRKPDAGKPMVFGTTEEFLHIFRLGSLSELPSLTSFQVAGDLLKKANDKIAGASAEVDVEEFIADADQDAPEVSEGLIATDQLDERGGVADEAASAEGETLEGAKKSDTFDEPAGI